MDKVFDTVFETSLRVLLTLDAATGIAYTIDRIAAVDFLAVYNREFGLSNNNLHGENVFRFSEYTLRRELIGKTKGRRGLIRTLRMI